jgi:hypothetical protein
LYGVLAIVTMPLCAIKHFMNFIQLLLAAQSLAARDQADAKDRQKASGKSKRAN